jgi:hypothetical protein
VLFGCSWDVLEIDCTGFFRTAPILLDAYSELGEWDCGLSEILFPQMPFMSLFDAENIERKLY